MNGRSRFLWAVYSLAIQISKPLSFSFEILKSSMYNNLNIWEYFDRWRKYDTEIRKCIEIVKDVEESIKIHENFVTTKRRVLICYVITVLPYGSEWRTIYSQMKNKLKAKEMYKRKKLELENLALTGHTEGKRVR